VQYYESVRKWCNFWFLIRYFQVNAPLRLQHEFLTSLLKAQQTHTLSKDLGRITFKTVLTP